MARKGIKHNNYTVEFIQEVLEKYYSGQGGFTSLANEYKIPIKTWIYRTNKGINVFKNKKTNSLGRPKEFEIPDLHKSTTKEKIIFINLYLNLYSLKNMCEVLKISTRTYINIETLKIKIIMII